MESNTNNDTSPLLSQSNIQKLNDAYNNDPEFHRALDALNHEVNEVNEPKENKKKTPEPTPLPNQQKKPKPPNEFGDGNQATMADAINQLTKDMKPAVEILTKWSTEKGKEKKKQLLENLKNIENFIDTTKQWFVDKMSNMFKGKTLPTPQTSLQKTLVNLDPNAPLSSTLPETTTDDANQTPGTKSPTQSN